MKPLVFFSRPLATLAPRDLLLLEHLESRPTDVALEIGIGSGSSLFRLANSVFALHGADIAAAAVERLQRATAQSGIQKIRDAQLFQCDFCTPAASDRLPARYDLIFSCDTVEHVAQPDIFFKNVHDSLAPGGRVFITFPNEHPTIAHGITWFDSRTRLLEILFAAGFHRDHLQVDAIKMNAWSTVAMRLGWGFPRWSGKAIWSLCKRRRTGAPQTFNETDFFAASARFERFSPLINAYCWAVMKTMGLASPVYKIAAAKDDIWNSRLLIRAARAPSMETRLS